VREVTPQNRPGATSARGNSDQALPQRLAKIISAGVFGCLLFVTVFTALPYGTVDPWWEAVFECSVFVLTALWVLEVVLRGSWQVRGLFILVPLFLITAYAFAQTIELPPGWLAEGGGRLVRRTLTIDPYQTHVTARKSLALTLFLGLLLVHTTTSARLRWLARVVVGLGLASALFGLVRQFLQSSDSPSGFVLTFLSYGTGYGQFMSRNVFAYLMEMTLGVVSGILLGGGVDRKRFLIYLPVALLIWTALVLSNSRGGVLSLICLFIFLLFVVLTWYSARRAADDPGAGGGWLAYLHSSVLIRVFAISLIAVTFFAGVLWLGGERLAERLSKQELRQQGTDGNTREEVWRSTWKLIKHHPVTGSGFGTYFLAITQFHSGSGRVKVEQAHNDYLDLVANGGLVAAVLAAWFVGIVIWRARSRLQSRDKFRRAACLGALAGMLGAAVHSSVDFGLQVTGIAVVFAALVVIAVADVSGRTGVSKGKNIRPSLRA